MSRRILVLNTPAGQMEELAQAFRAATGGVGEVEVVACLEELLARLGSGLPHDLVVVDYLLGDGTTRGIGLLAAIHGLQPEIPVVAVAEKGDVQLAAEAVRGGAMDFLVRGGQLSQRVDTLLTKVRKVLELMDRNRLLREQNRLLQQADSDRYRIAGESPEIREVIERIERVARIPRPVLITGERGTGKELVARAIHVAGDRARGPFVVVNCAAFPDTLLESELFGHEKGSFTGADSLSHGKFEQADRGTLFLDEIAHMSLPFQQKVLRVVEYGTFTRVGGASEIRTSARIVAASNADLRERIAEGRFLPDLYDRLAFEVICVPPLRQRRGDIDVLARHFLQQFMREIPALGGKRLGETAMRMLRRYDFPGNVRELKNIIERAAYRDTSNEITPEDIGLLPAAHPGIEGQGFEDKVRRFQRQLLCDALEQSAGNQARAARLLGLSYHRFRYYYRRYGKTADKP